MLGCGVKCRTMNAIEKDSELDALNTEYDRLKPLRDLEELVRDRPSNATGMIIYPVLLTIAAGGQIAMNFGLGQALTLVMLMAAICSWAVYFQIRLQQDYWSKVAKTLRTLADDVNRLRAVSK